MEKKTILIAEDNDSNYLLLNLMLRKDYNLVRATNGKLAVQMAHEQHPDLILMDIRMPEMDGLQALAEIRKDLSVPVIMQSSFAYDETIKLALDQGADGYLTKPIMVNSLLQELHKFGL